MILEGVNKLADGVQVTMGPKGRNVLIDQVSSLKLKAQIFK